MTSSSLGTTGAGGASLSLQEEKKEIGTTRTIKNLINLCFMKTKIINNLKKQLSCFIKLFSKLLPYD